MAYPSRAQILIESAQEQQASHSMHLALEHLRNAAQLYELSGRGITGGFIRKCLVALRKQAFLHPEGAPDERRRV